jgi:phage-related protein
MSAQLKVVEWIASSIDDLKEFPEDVQQSIG